MSNSNSGLLKFITCGSVDDGKSTLIGHILYNSKLLYADQEQALLLASQVGSRGGDIDYSLLLDGLMAEREQGITIDVAYRYFTTDKRSFIVADTPGHEEYTRNMAVGASFADLSIILVDASKGVLAQTIRHARICVLMGIRNFIFAINKMDLIDYDNDRFNKISEDINKLSEELRLENKIVIPVSATEGDNVTKYSDKMPWYKGESILEYLENVNIDEGVPESGFYMPIQRVCRPDHSFRGFQGQIESGSVSVNDTITALPSGEMALVKSIYAGTENVETAFNGQPVTIQLDKEVDVSRGCVLVRNANLKIAKSFSVTLLWMDDLNLVSGKEYWIKLGTKLLPAIITGIRYKVDINTGEQISAYSISKNEIVRCEIVLSESIVLDEFKNHKTLGELILIDRVSNNTVACGVVETVGEEQENNSVLTDGKNRIKINLFDRFYYHPDLHTVMRHSPTPIVYLNGDKLPLDDDGFTYPANFDIKCEFGFANIRNKIFVGFGSRDSKYILLDSYGIQLEIKPPRNFGEFRRIMIWEKDYEI